METVKQSVDLKVLKILVVEDKKEHQGIFNLEKEVGSVKLATTFSKAASLISSEDFDVLLTDLYMPLDFTNVLLHLLPPSEDKNKEEPLGIILCSYASKKGIQYTGILSETNRHQSLFTAAMNILNDGEEGGPVINSMYNCQDGNGVKNWLKCLQWTLRGYGVLNDI